jgi:hypothetical protein
MKKLLLFAGKRVFQSLFVLLFSTSFAVFLFQYNSARERIVSEHNDYKRFLYLLGRAERVKTEPLSEKLVRKIADGLGLKIYKIEQSGGYYRIVIQNLTAPKVIPFLKRLGEYGKVVKFDLVDNSGRGQFFATIVVSTSHGE